MGTQAFRDDWATIKVLWRRDLMRFWRQPARLVGALGQPIIFWTVIGSGMSSTFQLPNSSMNYLEYFYPGVVMMVGLFASIFASVSVIEDRHQGFLQAVMTGPGSRTALVLGKCLGSSTVALVQIGLFLLLAPWAGFEYGTMQWSLLLGALLLSCMGLCALGFVVAWFFDSVQAYHAIQMTFLVPLWVISGAMFPISTHGLSVFGFLLQCNPVAYAVAVVRHALYGGHAPEAAVLATAPWVALLVVGIFTALSIGLAAVVCEKRRS